MVDCRCDWPVGDMPGSGMNFSSVLFEDCDNTLGCLSVATSYVILLIAFAYIVYRGFRTKSAGMPLIGVAGLLGTGVIVLLHTPPFKYWWNSESTVDLFPDDVADRMGVLIAWWVHVAVLLVLLVQHALYGRRYAITPLVHRYFYWIAIGVPFLVLITQWFFVVYYRDFYVNEVYPVSTLIMAAGYFTALVTRRARLDLSEPGETPKGEPLRGLSMLGAWGLAIGTTLLYLGTILGGPELAYTDHAETGYCLVYWVYGMTVALLWLYAGVITSMRRSLATAPDRPSL